MGADPDRRVIHDRVLPAPLAPRGDGQLVISDWRLWTVVVQTLALGLPIAAFLRRRGWGWADMSEPVVLPRASTEAFTLQVSGAFSWTPMLAAAVLDPIAEELLWLGYIVNALRHRGIWFAAAVSIGLRTMVHAYQGPLALVGSCPLACCLPDTTCGPVDWDPLS
jgi:membrane protease YdiL (CAAX protease family)